MITKNTLTLISLAVCAIAACLSCLSAEESKASDRERVVSIPLGGTVTLEVVRIEPGEFAMGEGGIDPPRDMAPQHKVVIKKRFYIGKYPITREQYGIVMQKDPTADPKFPIDGVSWEDAKEFCMKLRRLSNKVVRLPTEAEWEYSCRAGTSTRFSFGNVERSEYTWCGSNDRPHPVGGKLPNAWGLHDMHGLVSEWCEDDWHSDYDGAPVDGTAWVNCPRYICRVYRGKDGGIATSARRYGMDPKERQPGHGFRVVVKIPEEPPPELGGQTPERKDAGK